MEEAYRILNEARDRGILLRLIGAVAFKIHCPKYVFFQNNFKRVLSDIDYASYAKHHNQVKNLFLDMGYEEYGMTNVYLAGKRFVFHDEINNRHSDIFFDELDFNHTINWKNRLEIDYPTISLADLMLEKMQIVEINKKDIIDSLMLLREHEIDSEDKQEKINAKYIAQVCGNDWGFWKTITVNLKKVRDYAFNADNLKDKDKDNIIEKMDKINRFIEKEPKSLKWKMRAKIGDKKRWYTVVEELQR